MVPAVAERVPLIATGDLLAAIALRMLGDGRLCGALLRIAVAFGSRAARRLFAQWLERRGNFEAAILQYNAIMDGQADPDDTWVRLYSLLEHQRRFREAAEVCRALADYSALAKIELINLLLLDGAEEAAIEASGRGSQQSHEDVERTLSQFLVNDRGVTPVRRGVAKARLGKFLGGQNSNADLVAAGLLVAGGGLR